VSSNRLASSTQETRLGVTVRRLVKARSPRVCELAKQLLARWTAEANKPSAPRLPPLTDAPRSPQRKPAPKRPTPPPTPPSSDAMQQQQPTAEPEAPQPQPAPTQSPPTPTEAPPAPPSPSPAPIKAAPVAAASSPAPIGRAGTVVSSSPNIARRDSSSGLLRSGSSGSLSSGSLSSIPSLRDSQDEIKGPDGGARTRMVELFMAILDKVQAAEGEFMLDSKVVAKGIEEGTRESESALDKPTRARSLTRLSAAMYKKHGSTGNDYKAQYRSLCFNLKNNADLLASVCSGMISPEQLTRMTSEVRSRVLSLSLSFLAGHVADARGSCRRWRVERCARNTTRYASTTRKRARYAQCHELHRDAVRCLV